jgi:hypothetical protein
MNSIEWFLSELEKVNYHPTEAMVMYAKKLHKQEMVKFGYDCISEVVDSFGEVTYNKVPEEVYQETFKKD